VSEQYQRCMQCCQLTHSVIQDTDCFNCRLCYYSSSKMMWLILTKKATAITAYQIKNVRMCTSSSTCKACVIYKVSSVRWRRGTCTCKHMHACVYVCMCVKLILFIFKFLFSLLRNFSLTQHYFIFKVRSALRWTQLLE
jgi:hypothetical protein